MSYGGNIPSKTKQDFDRYVTDGIPVSGFLYAVLTNDLFDAVGRADHLNQPALPSICGYVYNNMPSICWGTSAKVKAWLDRHEARRQNEHTEATP